MKKQGAMQGGLAGWGFEHDPLRGEDVSVANLFEPSHGARTRESPSGAIGAHPSTI